MTAKLFVTAAMLAVIWIISKLLRKIVEQRAELRVHRQHEAASREQHRREREADIIDLEQDPETGSFREKRK
ncbi:hypothetical protein [uncultured Cohaesibacter sp.]|uniref:hypothetical protein n=1 Tax=uncultured Cohaesibacter sp. TaxID=1002546 RepID=UPI00292F406F|nr:hypothetical protein [uncultured Cohaesibacter sp.]